MLVILDSFIFIGSCLLRYEVVFELLTSQRVRLVNNLLLLRFFLVFFFLEDGSGANHRHVTLLLLFRHLPLHPHLVLKVSIIVLNVGHIIMCKKLFKGEIRTCKAFGVQSLLLFLSFTFLVVQFLSCDEGSELSLSDDAIGLPVSMVRVDAVLLTILNLEIGASDHERVVDFLQLFLLNLLGSVSILFQGDKQIWLLHIFYKCFIVQLLSIISLRLFNARLIHICHKILVIDITLEIKLLLVDQFDEIIGLLVKLFKDLLICTLEELVILLAQNQLSGALPSGQAALLETSLKVRIDKLEKILDWISLINRYGYDERPRIRGL